LLALYILKFQLQWKSFAVTMIILGVLESGIFWVSYFTADERESEKIAVFETDSTGQADLQRNVKKNPAVIILSKVNLSTATAGVLIALMLHAGLAATIDSFGEQHTKKFLAQLGSVESRQ
jgi:hypothetical protein